MPHVAQPQALYIGLGSAPEAEVEASLSLPPLAFMRFTCSTAAEG